MSQAEDLERIAMLYVEGLLAADGSAVPFTDDVKRSHLIVVPGAPLAWQVAQGADIVRGDFARERLTTRHNMRVTVDVARGSVVLLWESGMESEYARAITIMDRFLIAGGLIREVEIISIPQGQPFGETPYAGWDEMVRAAQADG